MRFRFGEGEEQLFVADILPMLDIEDEESSTDSSGGDSSSASACVVEVHTSCYTDEDLKAGKLIPASRARLQARSKIERLRQEIQTLGVELADLQSVNRGLTERSPARSRWKALATKRKRQRERAEHDNKVLKRMIAAQNMLAESILNGRFQLSSGIRCVASTSSHRKFPRINV
ncbi:hypothetical protein P3T76_010526 [Phytophthora citrophthora]|uniref:Uncharacterized protein n=1 Tax=Phytophthora citrophthora TaxID=4793 RepID=A0AAD9GCF9_9STRA|nr:hypothetical protein P3T76_010526 [Phytophthora citrophthora]